MQVEVYARHSAKCPYKKSRYHRKCRCRKWLAIAGQDKRISAKTRSWEQAERVARELRGENNPAPTGRTVSQAVQAYLDDKQQQSLSRNWAGKITRELRSFEAWCNRKAVVMLAELKLEHLEQYRKEWSGAPVTRRKRQERLRSFFLYCVRHKWIMENLASLLSPIKVQQSPTLPLTKEQFARAVEAAKSYNPKAPDVEWRRQRATAMLLLLRWSGLRLGDAARLERTALTDTGNLRLYQAKTGESVYVPLPPEVVRALRDLDNTNPRYFFWNGGDPVSTVKRWWSTLKKIFRLAGIPEAHPHQLRDTFAVSYLMAGVPIDRVSILLGHSSIKVTERHYLAWVRERQEQLERDVRNAWGAI
ncbi:MAG TPA: site-specific integrase [Candidatus Limnocylindrales bacterium]|nr:site-specific integrase [Candidatus Limnocylindrales bacterium]